MPKETTPIQTPEESKAKQNETMELHPWFSSKLSQPEKVTFTKSEDEDDE